MILTLKNGAQETIQMVQSTIIALDNLFLEYPIAFYELVMKCRDANHQFFGNTGAVLQSRNLVEDDSVPMSIQNVVLSAVRVESGERLALSLGTPMEILPLKNGSQEALPMVQYTMMQLRMLLHECSIAFYELVMKCRDANHQFSGFTRMMLQARALIGEGDKVPTWLQNVVLSAVRVEGPILSLGSPLDNQLVGPHKDWMDLWRDSRFMTKIETRRIPSASGKTTSDWILLVG